MVMVTQAVVRRSAFASSNTDADGAPSAAFRRKTAAGDLGQPLLCGGLELLASTIMIMHCRIAL
jgi:hypothetical protein